MATQIDIPIEPDLQSLLELPPCNSIRLPLPKPLKLQLPSGGSLSALADISKGIPTDCAYSFSLLMQVAPLLASMECLLKILKLLKPLIDIVNGLPAPPSPGLIKEFADAVKDIIPCFLIPTPANIIPFLKDLLCLILKFLKCFLGQMKTIRGVLGGVTLRLNTARSTGNLALAQALECAQENAQLQAQHLTAAIEPIGVILDLAGALFGIAGIPKIELKPPASPQDLDAVDQVISAINTAVIALQAAVDVLGGCD